MTESKFTEFLSDHPRMIGALFTMMVFLSTTGAAAANYGASTSGP